ncbi:TraB/GumN family protein [Methylosinus sp. Sm6]|uniref:TraB/GumN family protein n=1 Tax=Methylosinus sp. Sm6 TaxID=2866948 RepID=UPI001C992C15|nr:TraB/GumN family protein [Methylosinus sp. Sm6]MBY6241273.1 TraB/GumN family protein [Methylosinus sp. Sm6]
MLQVISEAERQRSTACFVRAAVTRAAVAAALWAAFAPPPAALAACRGRDLFPILKTLSPLAFARMAAEVEATPFAEGRLFRLTGAGGESSYLFGSLHLADPRATNFSPALREALARSDTIVLEMAETAADLDRIVKDDPARMRATLVAEKDRRAERLLSRDELGRLEALLRNRRVGALPLLDLKAPALALLLDLPPCADAAADRQTSADALLAEAGRRNGAAVVGLETFFEQIDSLDGLTRAEERDLLAATLKQADQAEDAVETTLQRYSEKNLGWLLAWMRSADPLPFVAGAQVPAPFLDRLITRRNYRMRDRALPIVARGGAFIAVGAAHLPGTEGLLSLFRQAGYEIERIE